MARLVLSITVLAAALCLGTARGRAQMYGDAPWCAVVAETDGEMTWLCQYRTFEECAPNVIAGNRGFCNVNPARSSTNVPKKFATVTRHKHQARPN